MTTRTERPRIALDLDGVVYNYSATACYLLNHYKGYQLDWEQTNDWNWLQSQVSNNDWQWLWSAGVKKYGLFRYGHLIKGAKEGVDELAKLGEIHVVTHRPIIAVQDTLDYLAFMRFPLAGVHILSNGQNKAKILPKFDVGIDDKPQNIEDYINEGIEAVAYMHTYNEGKIHDFAFHSYDWPDVVGCVDEALNDPNSPVTTSQDSEGSYNE